MSGPYGKSDKTGRIKRLGRQASGISDALGASGTSVAWYKDFGRSKNAKLTKDEPQEKPLMSGDTETTPAEDTKLEGSGVADDQTVMTSRVSQILTGDSTGSPRASMISKRTLQRSSGKLVLDASDKQSESGQPWYRQFSNLRKDSKSARNLLANVQKVDPVEGEPTIHPFQHNQLADSKQQDITTNNRRSWLQMRSTDGRDLECQTVGTESVDDFFEHCVEMSAEVEEIRAAAKLRAKYSLDPSSPSMQAWDILLSMLSLLQCIFIPLQTVFEDDDIRSPGMKWTIFCFYLLDMPVTACMAKQRTGTSVAEKDLKALWKLYIFSTKGLVDLITLVAIHLPAAWALLSLIKLFRLSRISNMTAALHNAAEAMGAFGPVLVQLTYLALAMLMVTHWLSCIWIEILQMDGEGEHRPEYDFEDHFSMYLIAYQTCLSLLSSHSNLQASTNRQNAFVICGIVLGAFFMAVIVANTAILFNNMNLRANRRLETRTVLRDTKDLLNIPPEIYTNIKNYQEYLELTNFDLDGLHMLRNLPPTMYLEIANALFSPSLEKVPLFADCEDSVLAWIAMQLQPRVYLADQPVVLQGDIGQEMHIIIQGSVQVLDPHDPWKTVAVLKEGDFYGELSLLCGIPCVCTIVAIVNIDVLVLAQKDFLCVIEQYPEIEERIRVASLQRLQESKNALAMHNSLTKPEGARKTPGHENARRPAPEQAPPALPTTTAAPRGSPRTPNEGRSSPDPQSSSPVSPFVPEAAFVEQEVTQGGPQPAGAGDDLGEWTALGGDSSRTAAALETLRQQITTLEANQAQMQSKMMSAIAAIGTEIKQMRETPEQRKASVERAKGLWGKARNSKGEIVSNLGAIMDSSEFSDNEEDDVANMGIGRRISSGISGVSGGGASEAIDRAMADLQARRISQS